MLLMAMNGTIIQGLKEMVLNHKAGMIQSVPTIHVCLIKSYLQQSTWETGMLREDHPF